MTWIPASPLAVLLVVLASDQPADGPTAAVPLYTNADLERVRPLRDQTGVASVPAAPAGETRPLARREKRRGRAEATDSAPDESYWRREAARHHRRQEALAAKAEALERRIEQERRRRPHPLRSRDDSALDRLRERLAAIERQRREEDDAFEERARRAGALPGWLR